MGGVTEIATRGRRFLDESVNLVPYVDILMTLMVFLAMCAVFQELSALTVQTSSAGKGIVTETDVSPIHMRLTQTTIHLERRRFRSTAGTADRRRQNGARPRSRGMHSKPHPPSMLVADDDVAAEDVIAVVDVARGAGIESVSVGGPAG